MKSWHGNTIQMEAVLATSMRQRKIETSINIFSIHVSAPRWKTRPNKGLLFSLKSTRRVGGGRSRLSNVCERKN